VKRSPQASMPPLDEEIRALLDHVREVFGDEVLAGIYERAQNAAIRQAGSLATASPRAPTEGRARLVSHAADDGFATALRNELGRMLTHH
jgi:predicted ArsR family transcriptional regulator